jgi:hypothetical protein
VPLDRVVEKRFGRLGPPRAIMKKRRKRRNLKASGGEKVALLVQLF